MSRFLSFVFSVVLALAGGRICAVAAEDPSDAYQPHTPTLIFYLTNVSGPEDSEAIRASVLKLASVKKINADTARGFVQVRFDSHVVSYHQVAEAIAEAGNALGKKYDPRLKIRAPEYAQPGNAAKVDAIFAGKRLNQRVKIEPVDKTKGDFIVHFLPLQIPAGGTGPEGFNGGHLNHPIHDPPPRGLGLTCIYASEDDSGPPLRGTTKSE
jgi:copper chaperone CopZ